MEKKTTIKVIGIGGAGGNAIDRMMQYKMKGIDLIAVNTDVQDLKKIRAIQKIRIGQESTHGLGAGMNPELGKRAAIESKEELTEALKGADMIFLTCGLGGGTGSGGSPIVAEVAREAGALVIGVVTKPFSFEGVQRARIAEEAWQLLKDRVDALITINNDRMLNVINRETPLLGAFTICDDVLRQAVQGISDLIITPGIINVDFADVRAIMSDAGSALMGVGFGTGEERATAAARAAVSSPLLDVSINGARGVLFNVSGGSDLTMWEINEAAKVITESIDRDAKVIFGAVQDEHIKKGELKITVIATGFNALPNTATSREERQEVKRPVGSAPEKGAPSSSHEENEWDTVPAFLRRRGN